MGNLQTPGRHRTDWGIHGGQEGTGDWTWGRRGQGGWSQRGAWEVGATAESREGSGHPWWVEGNRRLGHPLKAGGEQEVGAFMAGRGASRAEAPMRG